MKLKLINAERHICPAVGADVTLKGQVVTVSEEVGKMLLDEVRTDSLNNNHPVWQIVEEDEDLPLDDESENADDTGEDTGEGKPKRTRRAAAAKG